MQNTSNARRQRLSAAALALAGVLFVLYPAIRPFSDEVSLEGAAAFGSTNWLIAHMLAMVAFTLLPLGVLGLQRSLRGSTAERAGYWALVSALVGAGLTLPFYGAEAFGLFVIGREALRQGSAALLAMAAAVRSGAGLMLFLVGLLIVALAGISIALSLWRSENYSKWTGVPLGLGLALYIPQFFLSQPLRVAHGALVAVGCLWIGAALWRRAGGT